MVIINITGCSNKYKIKTWLGLNEPRPNTKKIINITIPIFNKSIKYRCTKYKLNLWYANAIPKGTNKDKDVATLPKMVDNESPSNNTLCSTHTICHMSSNTSTKKAKRGVFFLIK